MANKISVIEIEHDEQYGDRLLVCLNAMMMGKDMRALRVVEQQSTTLADFERMIDAEWEEALQRWCDSSEVRNWVYMLGIGQARDLLRLAKMVLPAQPIKD